MAIVLPKSELTHLERPAAATLFYGWWCSLTSLDLSDSMLFTPLAVIILILCVSSDTWSVLC